MSNIIHFRFEVDGDPNDYADCVHNVFARTLKEAFQKWNASDGRRVKQHWVVNTISIQ